MKNKKNLQKLLNLNYLMLSNKTISSGNMDLPTIYCKISTFPDFIALYSEVSLYNKTNCTAIAFYEYDDDFDGKYGLYWAIYYNVEERLIEFKKRFKEVKYVIIPDFSELGDIHKIENDYRLFKGRIVGLWFIFEIGAIVIPNITFPTAESVDYALDGYEESSVVAISTKGHMNSSNKIKRLKRNVHLTIDKLSKLDTIIVYDVFSSNNNTLDVFSYAIEKGIKVIIPENTLKIRNELLYNKKHNNNSLEGYLNEF